MIFAGRADFQKAIAGFVYKNFDPYVIGETEFGALTPFYGDDAVKLFYFFAEVCREGTAAVKVNMEESDGSGVNKGSDIGRGAHAVRRHAETLRDPLDENGLTRAQVADKDEALVARKGRSEARRKGESFLLRAAAQDPNGWLFPATHFYRPIWCSQPVSESNSAFSPSVRRRYTFSPFFRTTPMQ